MEGLNNLPPSQEAQKLNGTKGVAMSAGRSWIKEFYVGFLLLVLTFLYLSHLNLEEVNARMEDKAKAETSEAEIPDQDFFVAS